MELAEGGLGLAGVEAQLPDQAAVVVDQRADDLGAEVAHDRLADAADPLVGIDADEEEVGAVRGAAERFNLSDLHEPISTPDW